MGNHGLVTGCGGRARCGQQRAVQHNPLYCAAWKRSCKCPHVCVISVATHFHLILCSLTLTSALAFPQGYRHRGIVRTGVEYLDPCEGERMGARSTWCDQIHRFVACLLHPLTAPHFALGFFPLLTWLCASTRVGVAMWEVGDRVIVGKGSKRWWIQLIT